MDEYPIWLSQTGHIFAIFFIIVTLQSSFHFQLDSVPVMVPVYHAGSGSIRFPHMLRLVGGNC